MGACMSLGFDEAISVELQLSGAVELHNYICYDLQTHDFYPADDESECTEGYFLQMNWDCYGH